MEDGECQIVNTYTGVSTLLPLAGCTPSSQGRSYHRRLCTVITTHMAGDSLRRHTNPVPLLDLHAVIARVRRRRAAEKVVRHLEQIAGPTYLRNMFLTNLSDGTSQNRKVGFATPSRHPIGTGTRRQSPLWPPLTIL